MAISKSFRFLDALTWLCTLLLTCVFHLNSMFFSIFPVIWSRLIPLVNSCFQGNLIGRGVVEFCDDAPPVCNFTLALD